MKNTILLLLCTVLIYNKTDAQISLGPTGGFHLTNYHFRANGSKLSVNGAKRTIDLRAGMAADVPIKNRVHVQTGLLYTTNSFHVENRGQIGWNLSVRALEVPLFLSWHMGLKHQSHFVFSGGLFAAYNMGGKNHVIMTDAAGNVIGEADAKIKTGNDSTCFVRAFNAGAGLNLGYELKRGFFVRVHYQRGLKNLQPEPESNSASVTNNNYGLTVGWLFKTKNRKERKEQAAKPKPNY